LLPHSAGRCNNVRPMTKLVVHVADHAHAVGEYGNTLIQVWRGAPTPEGSAEVNRWAEALTSRAPNQETCSLWVVEPSSSPPDAGTRANLARFGKEIAPRMAMAVVVAEGGGFRSALVRSVGVALTRLIPHTAAFRFTNDVAAAIALLRPHLADPVNGGEALQKAVFELRSKIGQAIAS